jgi:peptidoglycan/LPS O-acetylase OafA/YrhL
MNDIGTGRRIAYIDGLRAVAVLGVVLDHTIQGDLHLRGSYFLAPLWIGGGYGVELFFVLSGFCLSYPTLLKLKKTGTFAFDTPLFAARRLVRILPPYYIAFALFLGLAVAFARMEGGSFLTSSTDPFNPMRIANQLLLVTDFDGTHFDRFLNGSFWTLPIEFRWYFLFPVLLVLWVRWRFAFFAAGVLAFALGLVSTDSIMLPGFMSGIVAAQLHINDYRLGRIELPMLAVFAALALITRLYGLPNELIVQAAAFLFVLVAGADLSLTKILQHPWLTAVGIASYSIYLVHEPIIEFVEAHGVMAPLAAIAGVFAGFAFWFVAERPFTSTKLKELCVSLLYRAFRILRARGSSEDERAKSSLQVSAHADSLEKSHHAS